MLRIEDCKPGVLVVAIKNVGTFKPLLEIGRTYTIEKFSRKYFDCRCYTSEEGYAVILEEITTGCHYKRWGYGLEQFELKRESQYNLNELFAFDENALKHEREMEHV